MYTRFGQQIRDGVPFQLEHGGETRSFPSNWLSLATQEDLNTFGIVFTPDPPESPVAQPVGITTVTPRQIRQALTRAGLRATVEAAVAAADQDTKDWWEFATSIERNNSELIAMAAALGVSDVALDDLFHLASTL